jgi:hypothetical protein
MVQQYRDMGRRPVSSHFEGANIMQLMKQMVLLVQYDVVSEYPDIKIHSSFTRMPDGKI